MMSKKKKAEEVARKLVLDRIDEFEKRMNATVEPVVKKHVEKALKELEERVLALERIK